MNKVVVDTNIVFSGILNTNSRIGDLLLNSNNVFEFYSVSYLKEELENHKEKIIKLSGLSENRIAQVKELIFPKIKFISEEIIPFEYWKRAAEYVRDVDMDDIAFVSLNLYMEDSLICIWPESRN